MAGGYAWLIYKLIDSLPGLPIVYIDKVTMVYEFLIYLANGCFVQHSHHEQEILFNLIGMEYNFFY